jgi:ribosome-associated heat shock protein Hsp15
LGAETIRIDKWLWHARFFKTRTLAQNFVTGGNVRVNSQRVEKANAGVKPGDVLTFVRGYVRVIEIVALADKRGPASAAQALYNDLSPPAPKKDDPDRPAPVAARERGTGRPTKRERRDIDRLRDNIRDNIRDD